MKKKQVRTDVKPQKAIIPSPNVLPNSITSGIKRMGIIDTKMSNKKLKISNSQNIHIKLEVSDDVSSEKSSE